MNSRRLPLLVVAVVALLALVVALPALAADPTASPRPSHAPGRDGAPGQHKDKQKQKAPKVEVTISGTVLSTTDAKGRPIYSLTAGDRTYELSAGPKWYWGDRNPLAAYVGKSVEIKGHQDQGSTEIDVEAVDGKALREPGKPPWAGGPWRVGPSHPGWKDWMAGGKPGHGLGREHAPGLQKDKSPEPEASGGS